VPERLPVHVNRKQTHSLEVPASFEATDSFVIEVRNHGGAGRVHVHLDGDLATVATVDDNNYYVEADATREIPVSVHDHRDAFGKIKVVVGYGATTRWVDIQLTEPDRGGPVEVGDELTVSGSGGDDGDGVDIDTSDDTEPSGGLADQPVLPVVGLGALAVVIAVGAAALVGSTVVTIGAALVVLVVVASVGFALT
jgi:hypothetical protein